jgi:hypothetical protein
MKELIGAMEKSCKNIELLIKKGISISTEER